MSVNEKDYMVIWEAPKLEKPEFRLYHDDNGAVVCYTGDKSIQGKYIVVDAQTFAEARPDVRVIDGKISRVKANAVVYKLMPDNEEGISCHPEDISIIVDAQVEHTKWKLNIYELR
jgi:hypothetical protein